MQRRKLNYRPTWNFTDKKDGINITSNFYPVVSAIAIVDEKTNTELVVMNDRSQAGSVIKDSRIELMMNRRTLRDDSRGVVEKIDETYYQWDPIVYHLFKGTAWERDIIFEKKGKVGIAVTATYYV
jgi:Glycosyl hydrolases family 38 C-terminal domain